MAKKAVKRVMKKKRQLKKQVKRQEQQEQQQMMRPQMMMGYGPKQYGNADGTMQQVRNQTLIDRFNNMTSEFRTLQNENKKYETMISEMAKKRKEEEHGRNKLKKDLEIEEDREKDMEITLKEKEYLN